MKSYLLSMTLLLLAGSLSMAQSWVTDIEKAKELAIEDDKTIIMVFQGSDWCVPCMKLNKEIWSTDEFIQYAELNYVMLQVDFPKRKGNKLPEEQEKKNKALADKYNKQGFFPYVVVLDKEENVLGSTGYKKTSPAEYIKILDSFIPE